MYSSDLRFNILGYSEQFFGIHWLDPRHTVNRAKSGGDNIVSWLEQCLEILPGIFALGHCEDPCDRPSRCRPLFGRYVPIPQVGANESVKCCRSIRVVRAIN